MSMSTDSMVFMLGSNLIDLGLMRVQTDSDEWMLSAREARILEVLYKAKGDTVETNAIYRFAWSDRGAVEGRPLTFAMRRLRQKLEVNPKKPQYLLTVRGIGFRLVGASEHLALQEQALQRDSLFERNPDDDFVGRNPESEELLHFLASNQLNNT